MELRRIASIYDTTLRPERESGRMAEAAAAWGQATAAGRAGARAWRAMARVARIRRKLRVHGLFVTIRMSRTKHTWIVAGIFRTQKRTRLACGANGALTGG